MTRNHRVRFMDNNYHEDSSVVKAYSSEADAVLFKKSNTEDTARFRQWKAGGHFEITTANQNLYVDAFTVAVALGNYNTGADLATAVQTALNTTAGGSGVWTVTYEAEYNFKIVCTNTVAYKFSNTTDAIWDTLGYTIPSDVNDTTQEADQQRNHTSEYVIWDLGVAQNVGFFAAVTQLNQTIGVTQGASIKLMGNNINDFTSPPLSYDITHDDLGLFQFTDTDTNVTDDTTYRYWKFEIIDRLNPAGPGAILISHLYLGDYKTLNKYNIATGFNKQYNDPSDIETSESGVEYFNVRQKYQEFSQLTIQFSEAADRLEIEQLFYDKGISTPFYISFDPTLGCSSSISELTKLIRFNGPPYFTHVLSDTYSIDFNIREII